LNFILRMRQYHTRSYQYDQINKTADRMYALFTLCNALYPSRLDDNILNIAKERYSEQLAKMARGEEGISAFEELYLYACPKFITANPPPYDDPPLLAVYMDSIPQESAQRHLALFISDVRAHAPVSTLRSFLKLYTSLDAKKLANFLDTDEEEMVQQMMMMKQASRSISRVGNEGSLLDGETVPTSDLDFYIDENMVHVVESTVSRRYGGWFIRNAEHAQRVFEGIHKSSLPASKTPGAGRQTNGDSAPASVAKGAPKVAWGGVKVA